MAIRGQEVHLKTEAYLAKNKSEAAVAANQSCQFLFPPEEGFFNHLTSVGEVPDDQLKAIVLGNEQL